MSATSLALISSNSMIQESVSVALPDGLLSRLILGKFSYHSETGSSGKLLEDYYTTWEKSKRLAAGVSLAKDFDELLEETVETTLKQVLGEKPAEALAYHMKVRASVPRAKAYADALDRTLGTGSRVVEKLMVKSLYVKVGMKFEDPIGGFSFEQAVLRAQEFMSKGGRRR